MIPQSDFMFALVISLIAVAALYLHQLLPSTPTASRPSNSTLSTHLPEPPMATTRTPYSENLITSLITERYKLLIKIGYFKEEYIIFPPPDGHAIDSTYCATLKIDPAVVSLMSRIPYIDSSWPEERPLFEYSIAFNFLEKDHILYSRDPVLCVTDFSRTDYLLPQDVALSRREDRNGDDVILDTRENTIRVFGMDPRPPPGISDSSPEYILERPNDPGHYRNNYAVDAPSFFRKENEKIRNLELIPIPYRVGFVTAEDAVLYSMKEVLKEKYGWPDEFKRDEWLKNYEGLWQELWEK